MITSTLAWAFTDWSSGIQAVATVLRVLVTWKYARRTGTPATKPKPWWLRSNEPRTSAGASPLDYASNHRRAAPKLPRSNP